MQPRRSLGLACVCDHGTRLWPGLDRDTIQRMLVDSSPKMVDDNVDVVRVVCARMVVMFDDVGVVRVCRPRWCRFSGWS